MKIQPGEIVHDESHNRFVVVINGLESHLIYRAIDPLTIDFLSTWVHPKLRGHGVAERLIEHALKWAKSIGVKIIPTCTHTADYIARHPEWESIVSSREDEEAVS